MSMSSDQISSGIIKLWLKKAVISDAEVLIVLLEAHACTVCVMKQPMEAPPLSPSPPSTLYDRVIVLSF